MADRPGTKPRPPGPAGTRAEAKEPAAAERWAAWHLYLTLALGGAVGSLLWLLWLEAPRPPWELGGTVLPTLLAAGFVLGVWDPRNHWAGPLGLYLGQAVALAFEARAHVERAGLHPVPLQLLFLASFNLAALVGATAAAALRHWWLGEKPPPP